MDYLGWELARQRAALWALLGGGDAEEEERPSEEETSAWGQESSGGGTRRSLAGPGRGGRRGAGRAGRYAGEREQAPLAGGPGAWERVREAAEGRLGGTPEGPEAPVSAWERISSEEAVPSARGGGDAETGAPAAFPWIAPEEPRRTPRFGTGGALELSGPSGGRNAFETAWETEAESGMEARLAAEAAGGRRAEGDFAAGGPAWKTGPSSERRTGGGEAAGDMFAAPGRGGTGTARPGGGAPAETAGQGGRRVLPWEGGRESAALRAEAEARALSRAVQRDARRYDGGFTIY